MKGNRYESRRVCLENDSVKYREWWEMMSSQTGKVIQGKATNIRF